MPKTTIQEKILTCQKEDNLRQVLLKNVIDLYNGNAKYINCLGIGTCGTCAVEIEGEINPPNWRDKTRRSFPPHKSNRKFKISLSNKSFRKYKSI